MGILKNNEISRMSEKEIKEKLGELKLELIKSKITSSKSGKTKIKEIKKTIARLLTFNRQNKKSIDK